jgi:hypothetical protein
MARGDARRVEIGSVDQLAGLIDQLPKNQAIALGALRTGLPDQVEVVTKAKLLNGAAQPNIIARTGNDIIYREGQSAFALLDFDTKGMPDNVAAELKRLGGFWEALVSVLPALTDVARVVRRSTSAGLSRSDTGEQCTAALLHYERAVIRATAFRKDGHCTVGANSCRPRLTRSSA